jgi:hypothetical protein
VCDFLLGLSPQLFFCRSTDPACRRSEKGQHSRRVRSVRRGDGRAPAFQSERRQAP